MNNLLKKIIVATIAVIFIFEMIPLGFVGIFGVRKTEAITAAIVADAPRWIQWIMEQVQKYWKDYIQPVLRDVAAKKITDYITEQTLNWINNGEKPTFVGDWNQFLNDAGDIALDSVNTYLDTKGVDLCSPFAPQIKILLKSSFTGGYIPPRCTVENFKQNIENTEDWIKNGNWISYSRAFMPDGNPFGLYVSAYDQVLAKAEQEKEIRKVKAQSSSGYLGQEECTDAGAIEAAESYCSQAPSEDEKNKCITERTQATCESWSTVTPGDVAAKAVANMVTADTQWGANIQSFTSAVINALISKLFQKGLSSLQSSSAASDYDPGEIPGGEAQINEIKVNIGGIYDDVIYYLNSEDYPTLQIWKDVQTLSAQGLAECSGTPEQKQEWQNKYDGVTQIVNGLQIMINDATQNMTEVEELSATMSASEITQRIQEIQSNYSIFQSSYGILLDDVNSAKMTGDTTEIEKTGIKEKNNLVQALSTSPNCGSPNIPQE